MERLFNWESRLKFVFCGDFTSQEQAGQMSTEMRNKPFLKWAGSKLRIVGRIKAVLPPGRRLVEPFVGSGALFLNTDYPEYLLADANKDLINLYRQLQDGGLEFIDYCRGYFQPEANTATIFYQRRERFNVTGDLVEKAALFVYLNKHCYNGLCRYNASGGFNVPFGRYDNPYFPAAEMRLFWRKAQGAVFHVADFVDTMDSTVDGDVIYCDPPYVPLSSTANFTSYSSDGFGLDAQRELARAAERAAQRGIAVLISNHNTDFTRTEYALADQIDFFSVQRHISCDGANRTKAAELLAVFQGDTRCSKAPSFGLTRSSANERTIN
jgi:DNA adenine methylase